MANIFKYKSNADYQLATNRPTTESSVSLAGEECKYDGKNVVLPFIEENCEVGDIPVYDTIDAKVKVLKWRTYEASSFNGIRYYLGRCNYFAAQNGRGCFVASENAPTPSNSNTMWAQRQYFRLTGFETASAGYITFNTYYNWVSHNNNTINWTAGESLASIASKMKETQNASYFNAEALADNSGIGVWVNYPTTGDMSSVFSIPSQSGGVSIEVCGKYNGNDVVWQYVTTNTIIPERTPAGSLIRRNGLVTSWAGCNLPKFVQYYETNGKAVFTPETRADPMNRATFLACGVSSVEAEKALYDKYNGSYEAYMANMLPADPTAKYILANDYDEADKQTNLLADVMTKDYNGNVVPAFPASYNIGRFGYNTAFQFLNAGRWGLPTAWQLNKIMSMCGYSSASKTDFNLAQCKINASGAIYGNGQYYWACSEYSANSAFSYTGSNGTLYGSIKTNPFSCRGVVALDFEN